MMILARSILPLSMMMTLVGGCSHRPDGSSSADNLQGTPVVCQSLTVASGAIGAGQSATALAKAELSGSKDVWQDYVELAPGTSVVCTFTLPAGTTVDAATKLAMAVNYRGPTKAQMAWTFEAWDASAQSWVAAGDNGFARDWIWSATTLPLPTPATRLVAGGQVKLRFGSTSQADSADLDQWILLLQAGTPTSPPDMAMGGAPGDMATPPPGDAGTPPDSGTTTGRWQPAPHTSWQWQLTGTIDQTVDVQAYDIDLFDNADSVVASLKKAGRKVVCYFSAGTYENWRSDAGQFPKEAIGAGLPDWPGENWLDTRSQPVRDIMTKRIAEAQRKGCDAVEPDNVDGYANNSGFPLTAATQLDYNRFLATTAHAHNLSLALKNDLDQVQDLVGDFDFALNEQCFQYSECDKLQPFIAAKKAVFEVEYGSASLATTVCPKANGLDFDTLIKNLNLDAWRVACR